MQRTRPFPLVFGAIAALCVVGALGWFAWQRATVYYFTELHDRGQNTLNLAEASLRGQLSRFERLPQLLADQRVIRSLILAPRDPDLVMAANIYLRDTAEMLGASDIYVMYRDGVTLAASNFDQAHSFVGGNFAFRPYFYDALGQKGAGRFYALGTTSNKRGYYFGAPIDVAGQRHGVMVIKIDVDGIEQAWASDEMRIIVTDPENIVFLSNRPDWLFRSFGPMTPARLARTEQTRRYANARIGQIDYARETDANGFDLLRTAADDGATLEYLVARAPMPDADWTVQVLLNARPARVQVASAVALGGLALVLLMLTGLILWQRRRQLAERLAVQQAARDELELRVGERTSQLAAANAALRDEVGERRATEDRLRQTQSELVQAGKLAALGQMSAALSHEFNQPLAAARNYAENAQLLLDRGRSADAHDNITRILGMIDRMGRISRHLRNFARKPHQQMRPVDLGSVIADAQELLGWQLDRSGVVLNVDLGSDPLVVTAGAVRLQQVLVNLLANAIDAVDGNETKQLDLVAGRVGDMIELRLRDNGPGIAESVQARIFDPFFSTKEVGKGLGLGLSISYNIIRDFDGRISVRNHPEGGAEFTLRLHAAQPRSAEAAE
ncbi:sensor histidine kinase [Roseinatronobacter alkalisoli]|uniref:histidine kinase n=1 Tax=Roseinatronobacter alkalisoli TaxID=3028235 RepID=A0ABT5T716_9RHOB|nr:ATP-binding protein [Roseinatronobacter sp. HJB301]MDD7970761.1 ATP-binding protein [Roseinatronobacter sp. HJB301]